MELPQEIDNFIKNSIDYTLGLSIPDNSLQLKLQSLETLHYHLRSQYLSLQSQLKDKDEALQLARGEANMNAVAIKKFVEENQKLANECRNLVNQCSKLEQECSLYDQDREVLMDFGNEANERAKEAEVRVSELEKELNLANDQLLLYQHRCDSLPVDSSKECKSVEQTLIDTLVVSLVNKDEVTKTALAFLEASKGVEVCRELLKLWDHLRPESQNILSLVANVQTLQKDKEHLRVNLHTAEEEVKVLFEENSVLDEENKRLLKLYSSERKRTSSERKRSGSVVPKRNKRINSTDAISSPVEKKIDFDLESPRRPLSPLEENSPGSKSRKK